MRGVIGIGVRVLEVFVMRYELDSISVPVKLEVLVLHLDVITESWILILDAGGEVEQ